MALLLLGTLPACGRILDEGVYAFSTERIELRTCEDLPLPPTAWEGEVQTFGREVQIALPTIHLAIGDRTLVGRFFRPEEGERDFIANSSFRLELIVGEERCPAFVQLGVEATTVGDGAFFGSIGATYALDPIAPLGCPRNCAWSASFHAERIGDTMQESQRSEP